MYLGTPEPFVEPDLAAVQMVLAVIAEKGVLLSVKRKMTLCYAVADSADHSAEISVGMKVAIKRVIAAHDAYARHADICDGRAEIEYFCRYITAYERVCGHGSAVRQRAEYFLYDMVHFNDRPFPSVLRDRPVSGYGLPFSATARDEYFIFQSS